MDREKNQESQTFTAVLSKLTDGIKSEELVNRLRNHCTGLESTWVLYWSVIAQEVLRCVRLLVSMWEKNILCLDFFNTLLTRSITKEV